MSSPGHASFIFYKDVFVSPFGTDVSGGRRHSPVEVTNFGSGGKEEWIPGKVGIDTSITGFVDESVTEGVFQGDTGGNWLVRCYRVPVAGDFFHAHAARSTGFDPLGQATVGQAYQCEMTFKNQNKYLLRGSVLFWGTTTSSGNGSGVNVGAMSAGDTLYAFLAVDKATVSGTNPTLDVVVQRSASDSWGAPSSPVTFSQATDSANTAQVDSAVTGAQAETWYRANYTIGGTDTPSFRWFCGIAITSL